MATCPNKSLKEWKDLVEAKGKAIAYDLWDQFEGNVPLSEYSGVSISSTIFELEPDITKERLQKIHSNYVNLMDRQRKGKSVPFKVFEDLLEKLQVYKYKNTYIFGNYDSDKSVFITLFNSSPTSKELLAEAIPNLVEKGVDFLSFVPTDYKDKLVRSGYVSSKVSFDYNFKGEQMNKFAVASNERVFNKVFNKNKNEVSIEEIEKFSSNRVLEYAPVEINENLIKSAGKDISDIFETYLNQFGILVKDISEIKDKLNIDEAGFADILSKIAYTKDRKDLPPIAGEFIAYMMQYNPLIKEVVNKLIQSEALPLAPSQYTFYEDGNKRYEYNEIDKTPYFKYIGKLIAEDLQNKLEGNYDKSLVFTIKKLIKNFFDYLINSDIAAINRNIGTITNNVMQQNKKLITASLYKPGADGKRTKQVKLLDALNQDSFGKIIIEKLSNLGFILTGSTSVGEQGTIQRPNENLLHDIDWVSPFNEKETIRLFIKEYPEAIFIRKINAEDYTTDSYLIAPDGYYIDDVVFKVYGEKEKERKILQSYNVYDKKTKEIKGDFYVTIDKKGKPKEVPTGTQGKVIDFFSYEVYKGLPTTTVEGVRLANWKDIFKAKLAWARYKDIWDYNRFIPNENVKTPKQKSLTPEQNKNIEPTILLPIGTSGSGKSTFIKTLPKDKYTVISPDEMRVEFTGNMDDKSKDKEIYEAVKERAIQAVKNGKSVIIDTTNLQKDRRRDFINAINSVLPNTKIEYKLLELNPELAKQRIKAQIQRGENRANVPDSTIDRHALLYKEMLEDIKSENISKFQEPLTPEQSKNIEDKRLNEKIKAKLQQLYPEIELKYSNNPIWEQGDNVFNQEIQDDYFEGNQIKYFTEIEKISNLILNKLKFKLKDFNGKYDDTITSLVEYKDKVLNDLLQNIGIQGVNSLEQLKIKLNSTELQQELKTKLQEVKINKDQRKTELDNFYHVKRLLNNFLKHQDINKYDQEQQETIRQYLPSLFKENKFKSDKQAFAFLKRKINTPEWGNKTFNLDKIILSFLGNNAKIGKYETLINYFKIDKEDAVERIYNLVENELNRREKFFTSEKIQSKINAKIAEDKIKSDNDKAERERRRNEELNKYKNSTVVQEVEGFLGARNIHDLEDVLNSANINVELAIIKNNNHSLDKTPEGKQSNLYKDILNLPEVNGDIEIAKKLKSLIYSDDFQNWFGDWINNSEESSKIVDENGEPKLVYHGSSREFSNFAKEQRGTTTGKWKDRMSDSEQSFMFTDSPTTAFYYAIIERQEIIGEILYYVRKSAQEPTTELVQEMYKKYPSIKNWVDGLKEKGLTKEEILKEFNRIYNEYSNIRDLKEGGAIGNQEANNLNTKKIIEYLRSNKTNLLKNGVKKNENYNTAIIPNSKDGSNPIWLWSSREYRTSFILGTGILNSFDNKDLNGKNIKDLTLEEFDLLVNEFEKDFIYNYEKIQDEIKAGGFTPKIYPVFLNAKTINSKDFKGRPFMFQQGDSEEVVAKRESKGAAFDIADLIDEAVKNNLDGTVIENITDPTTSTNYAIFESENIKSLFNKKDYTSLNNFYNQIVNNKIIGQSNIKAMTVLIDVVNQKADTLPHEYAHHYIAWYRNSPIVQEAIKKWGSEEALVQSIGEQVVLQKGEALNWWNEFTKWILDKFNNLSKLQKQELTQILTDAFLTRQDLNSPETIAEFKEFVGEKNVLTPEQNQNINDLKSIEPAYAAYTNEQIQAFIESKIPDSKVKEIVFHGSDAKFEGFLEDSLNYFGNKKIAEGYGKSMYPSLIDIRRPYYEDGGNLSSQSYEDLFYKLDEAESDGFISNNKSLFVPKEENQIILLSSPETIQEFKKFTNTNVESVIPKRDFFAQKQGVASSKANPKTLENVKRLLTKMGVSLQDLTTYAKNNPNFSYEGVNGLADLIQGIVAISEGKENVALVEEMVHIATAIVEQKNPILITELISKIDRFKIYKSVLAEYRKLKAYQLSNGKPDIRKIKREAVDKLIAELYINNSEGSVEFPELSEEVSRSWVRNAWESILDWLGIQYKKSNINLFQNVADLISEENIDGTFEEIAQGSVMLQYSDKQKEFQKRIKETNGIIQKNQLKDEEIDALPIDSDKATNWYERILPDGTKEKVKKRVTDRVKAFYKKTFRNSNFTEREKAFNEFKRKEGTKFHNFFEGISLRYFDSEGNKRPQSLPQPWIQNTSDREIYQKLDKYFVELIALHSKNGNTPLVFSEIKVYDPKQDEAGTIDLLIMDSDGKIHVYDWKFMSVASGSQDIAWYKQGAYQVQLERYKEILKKIYGVKDFGNNRAVPILMDVRRKNKRDPNSDLIITGISIGSLDPSKIDNLNLVPFSEKSESTGIPAIDALLKNLHNVYDQIEKRSVLGDEEKEFKSERLNIIKKAARMIQGTLNVTPLIEVISVMKQEGQNIIEDYEMNFKDKDSKDASLSNKQISEFSKDLKDYLAISEVFSNLQDSIVPLIYVKGDLENAKSKEEIENAKYRKKMAERIQEETSDIRTSKIKIEELSNEFADKFVGIRNLVSGLLNANVELESFGSFFRGISDLNIPSLSILFKLVTNARGFAERDAVEETDELMAIRKRLSDKHSNLKDYVKKIYQSDTKGNFINKLQYKYSKDFYDAIDANAKEAINSRKFLLESIDVDAYNAEVAPIIEKRIKSIARTYSDEAKVQEMILSTYQYYDINRTDFSGFSNAVLKRHPLEKWISKEYKEIAKDSDLLDLYNYATKLNDKAAEIGYIENKMKNTFMPYVRKGMAESLAWDFGLTAVTNWANNLKIRAGDVGFGSINELTGELENSIPKYFTYDFTVTEDGNRDMSDVSEDLFINLILYTSHVNKYKYLSDIEGQIGIIRKVETVKEHLEKNSIGRVVLDENDNPIKIKGNAINLKIYEQFVSALLYEQKYAIKTTDIPLGFGKGFQAIQNLVTLITGKKFKQNENPTPSSLLKIIDSANSYYQAKTLGLEFISGAANLFGTSIQMNAQAGVYFRASEFAKNSLQLIGNKYQGGVEREMLEKSMDIFMPLKDSPLYERMKKVGMSVLTRHSATDFLFTFMRLPEYHVETSIFKTLLDNTMVVDGKFVNINEFVKKKYVNRNKSAAEFRESRALIKEETKKLKNENSISATQTLQDGKYVIPGIDMKNSNELQKLTNLTRRISRNATGSMSDSDRNRASMNIWSKSAMVFKGWIPKLVDTRFGEFRKTSDEFSVELDDNGNVVGEKFDIGRIRLLSYVIGTSIRDKSANVTNILLMNDAGIESIDKLYNTYSQDYKLRTGQELTMTKDDFIDLIRTNLRNQLKELLLAITLVAASFLMEPPEEADKATKNRYRFFEKTMARFKDELLFFYTPYAWNSMLDRSPLPVLGLTKDIFNFYNHFFMEVSGIDLSNPDRSAEEVIKKALPIKYGARLIPFAKSALNYGAIIDSEFAKEYNITIQKNNK